MKFPRASMVIASVFGIGYFDIAPGTVMSAVAVPLALLIGLYGGGGMGILAASLIALVVGILACADHVRETGRDDPPECVIDELAGQWLACAFCLLPFHGLMPLTRVPLLAFALAFVLFRLFDIWKPWPVSLAEDKLPGGLGVMMDDIVAGLMAGVLVAAARFFFPMFSDERIAAARALLDKARSRGLSIVTAESCTGGLIAALLTEIPGASDVVERGFVTYSDRAKQELLGVPAALLQAHGAVSAPVARAMAEGALAHATARIAVAVTGIAGPGGGSAAKPVGLVHIAVALSGRQTQQRECRFGDIGRSGIRLATVDAALALLAENC